ncbi:MAG: hypothetical protein ACREL3_00845 [Gemmatimonadales bacterium]
MPDEFEELRSRLENARGLLAERTAVAGTAPRSSSTGSSSTSSR